MKIVIIEDDSAYADELSNMLKDLGHDVLSVVSNYMDGVFQIRELKPELVIADVHLKGAKDGIDVVKDVSYLGIPTIFISIDDSKINYEQSQKLGFYHFLIKPFHKFTLDSILRLIQKEQVEKQLSKVYTFKYGSKVAKIVFEDIKWFESERNYTSIITKSKKIVLRMSFAHLLMLFDEDSVIRIHKSFAIPMFQLGKVDFAKNLIEVEGIELPMGRSFKKDIRLRLDTMIS